MTRLITAWWVSAILLGLLCAGRLAAESQTDVSRTLLPIPDLPDSQLSPLEPIIQQHLRRTMERLRRTVQDASRTDGQRAAAYGEAGRVLQAYRQLDAAEPCYRNAELLAPQESRWPYYLGYLYQVKPSLKQAAASYEHALALRPEDPVTRLRLAQTYLELNRLDDAQRLLQQVAGVPALRPAALVGLGRVALARRDYGAAVEHFSAALAAAPDALTIHYTLAMAYRGLGDVDHAREHLDKRGDGEVAIPDPLIDGLDALMAGVRIHLDRAYEAARQQDFVKAAEAYGKAVELDPGNVPNRVRYARTLHIKGNRPEAAKQLQEALRLDAQDIDANFFMGMVKEEGGDDQAASSYYRKTLALGSAHAQAHYRLANALMRAGQYAEAAPHYRAVVQSVPQQMPARLLEALAMWRTGAPDRDVLGRLEVAHAAYPDYPDFSAAIARLRATSADPEVRDANKALELSRSLYARLHTADFAALVAMAYAALGRFDYAVATQQEGILLALQFARPDLAKAQERDLALYKSHHAREQAWDADDPVFRPPRLAGPHPG